MRRNASSSSPHTPLHQPLFSYGLELADLVVGSDLLHRLWAAISTVYNGGNGDFNANESVATPLAHSSCFTVRYRAYEQPNYTIIAFGSCSRDCQGGGEVLMPSPILEQNHPLFEFLCSKDTPSCSINQEAITHFSSLFDGLSHLHNQLGRSSSLIITGHSLGGSVAALFTLWLLENTTPYSTNIPLCITFGSPLIGDYSLLQAISNRQTWNHRFLHLISYHDIIPRFFVSPHNPSLVTNPSLQTNGYMPFGTFLVCSQLGCTCFEDPKSILDLMVIIGEEILRSQDSKERVKVAVFVDYGEVLEHLKGRFVYRGDSELQRSPSSLRAGLVLQLKAIGLEMMQKQNIEDDALLIAMENRERMNNFNNRRRMPDPSKKLNDIKINMALLEWYKKVCKSVDMGYYDCYKSRRTQRDMDVVKYKNVLTNYWKDMVRDAERKPQKQGAFFRTRWLFGGTNYRRMVEPLDIADYYKVSGQKEYKTQGRQHHYIMLERWQEEAEKAAGAQQAKTRTMPLSLTKDSCFWAYVEEAIFLSKMLKNKEEPSRGTEESLRKDLMKFESYVMGLTKNFVLSPETFLEKSSFMQWWREYELILEPEYSSELTEFMKTYRFRQYAREV